VGFAKPAFIDALAKAGFGHITNAAGALVLNTLLNRPALSQPPVFSFLPLHWARFAENGPAFNLRTDMSCFEAVKHRVVPKPTAAPMTPDLRAYSELEGPEQRAAMVERVVLQAVRDVTGQDVQAEDNLMERGIASLEAFELVETLRLRFPIQMDVSGPRFYSNSIIIPHSYAPAVLLSLRWRDNHPISSHYKLF
jgi:aryl carrier-like protein